MSEMKSLVQEGMEAGALGLSTGLIYPPGIYTSREEIESLCKVVADFQGSYTSHMRSEGDNVVEAVHETLDLGKTCGIPVTISHHKVVGALNEGKSGQTLALVDEAVNNGQIVFVDQYPYEGAGASLLMVIPPMFATEGPAVLLNKLKDPTFRNQLSGVLAKPGKGYTNLLYETTPERLLICGLNSHPELDGLSLHMISQKLGKDLYETLFDILCENSEAQAIFLSNCLSDMEAIMRHPLTMPGIDGMQSENKNPQDHPRVNATFPKIIGTYCRDYGFFPLEECIRKMTSLPARACNFRSKGILLEGKDADITIFDYDRINGPATYGKADLPNEGIEYVIVNGIIAVENGKITKQRAGKFLRRM
jgi:N-acyl-D-amino-acid deacylase